VSACTWLEIAMQRKLAAILAADMFGDDAHIEHGPRGRDRARPVVGEAR
jgi:hypothetical protein